MTTPETTAPTPTTRPRSLWRHADFMKLWSAMTVSQFGDEVTQLSIPFVAILTLGAGAFEMGLLGTFQFLPFILLTLPAGVWVDRMRRRPILIGADVSRAILLLSIPVAFIFGVLTLWQLFVVAFLIGCMEVFFDVAHDAYLPSIVGREQLSEGNAKFEISTSAAQVAGPGLAGFLVTLVSAPFAIFFDAASYLVSSVLVLLVGHRETDARAAAPDGSPAPPGPGMRTEVAEGLRYVLGHRYLRPIATCTATYNMFGNVAQAVLLLYVIQELGLSAATVGLVLSVGNVGVLLGALSTGPISRRFGVGPAIVGSVLLGGPIYLLVVLAPVDSAIPFLMAAVALGGWSNVVYNVNQRSLRQAITPNRMLGRMTATMRFIVWGTIPIGTLGGGILGELLGLRGALWVGAVGVMLAFLPVALSPVRSLMRIPDPQPTPAGS